MKLETRYSKPEGSSKFEARRSGLGGMCGSFVAASRENVANWTAKEWRRFAKLPLRRTATGLRSQHKAPPSAAEVADGLYRAFACAARRDGRAAQFSRLVTAVGLFRISGLGFPSDFGFRVSDFITSPASSSWVGCCCRYGTGRRSASDSRRASRSSPGWGWGHWSKAGRSSTPQRTS